MKGYETLSFDKWHCSCTIISPSLPFLVNFQLYQDSGEKQVEQIKKHGSIKIFTKVDNLNSLMVKIVPSIFVFYVDLHKYLLF